MTKLPKWRLLTSQRWNCLNLAVRNKGQRKLKHFTTASEIKSYQLYQKHLQKNKPPEMVAQYAYNKPASRPFNVKPSVAKKRFTQSKFRMIHALCSASNLRARAEKAKKTSVQANSQGHVSHCHELRSRV